MNAHIVIGTNNKLHKWVNTGRLDLSSVKLLAYDEADLLLTVSQQHSDTV